jgi:hypothetical protein
LEEQKKMTRKNTLAAGGLLALLLVLVLGVQALGFTGFKNVGTTQGAIQTGTNLSGASLHSAATGSSTQAAAPDASTRIAPANSAPDGMGVAQSSIAYPYIGGGPFQPGYPPYGFNAGATGDGLAAWGVAYQKTSDSNAKAGDDLIKAAYQDAHKQAASLASAAGLTLGKVLAISDYTMNQPYYTPCIQPLPAPAQGAPGATGQGSAGVPTTINPVKPGILPVPGPTSCNPEHYLVAWVMVRFAI